MTNHHHVTNVDNWKHCTCCGLKIRLLGDHQSLIFFMEAPSAQRRGYRCANCGQVTCDKCSTNGRCRTCRSNAWVALPYLDSTDWRPPENAKTRA